MPPTPPATHGPTTAQLVSRYASDFNARFAAAHTVTSPLGAWLLLAVAARASEGDVRGRLESVLGCSADDAAARAGALLRTVHPAVSSAAAIWAEPAYLSDRYGAFVAHVPAEVEHVPIPTQQAADRWASDHTGGMIPLFPVTVDDMSALVLATALATDVSWVTPFDAVPAAELGGPFGGALTAGAVTAGTVTAGAVTAGTVTAGAVTAGTVTAGTVDGIVDAPTDALRAPVDHAQFLATTSAASTVAVHVAAAAAGLDVISILAAPSVEPGAVHDAAHEVAAMLSGAPSTARRLSLFDVPVGVGAAWTITETEEVRFAMQPRVETYATWMAAWRAADTHHILGAPGFPELCETFAALLRPALAPPSFDAVQSAVAQYSRTGFRAAAVTGFGMRAGAIARELTAVHRHAEIRFNRPYAVVAVATDRTVDEHGRRVRLDASPWTGLPVFSAWVGRPDGG